MKRKARNSSKLPSRPADITSDQYLYFRLCHFCLHLNESSAEIVDCEKCKRHLTLEPLLRRMVNERGVTLDGMDEEWGHETGEEPNEEMAADFEHLYRGATNGLIGLSVFW